MKKNILLSILVVLLALSMTALPSCQVMDDAAKLDAYEVGGETVPSVKAVLGEERKVTGVESSTTNGNPSKQYTYASDTVYEDMNAYLSYFLDNGWVVTESFNTDTIPGRAQFGKESSEAGKIVIVSVAFEENAYAVKITKSVGELTYNSEE